MDSSFFQKSLILSHFKLKIKLSYNNYLSKINYASSIIKIGNVKISLTKEIYHELKR